MSQPDVVLYRMKLPDHECPYGLLAKRMLEDAHVPFDDRLLTSRQEVDAFEEEQGVDATPQLFVNGERIGGTEAIASWLETQAA